MKIVVCNIVLMAMLSACNTKPSSDKIIVYAASSLTKVLLAWDSLYCKPNNIDVAFNFGSSGTLARQIEENAPCDVYIPASVNYITLLGSKNLIDEHSVTPLAKNRLVFIASLLSRSNATTLPVTLPPDATVAIGDTSHVPAGKYAAKAMQKLGLTQLWGKQLVPAGNVRMALYLAEKGEVDYAFVFKSDANEAKNCTIIYEFDEAFTGPIQYKGAAINGNAKGKEFLDLTHNSALFDSILTANGFYSYN